MVTTIRTLGKLDWRGWLYSLVAAFISGGASAVTAGVSAIAITPDQYNLAAGLRHFVELVAATFIVSGVLALAAVLKQSPLPPEEKPTGAS